MKFQFLHRRAAEYLCSIMFPDIFRELIALRSLAMVDTLTGVLNRRGFQAEFGREYSHFLRKQMPQQRTAGFLLVVDLDHFKSINDKYGHPGGDMVLTVVASILKGAVRSDDVVGRWGGEEFIVYLVDADEATANVVAERIRASIASRTIPLDDKKGNEAKVTASIGGSPVAISAGEIQDFDSAFGVADSHMYAAKKGGRNRVIL